MLKGGGDGVAYWKTVTVTVTIAKYRVIHIAKSNKLLLLIVVYKEFAYLYDWSIVGRTYRRDLVYFPK